MNMVNEDRKKYTDPSVELLDQICTVKHEKQEE